MTDEATQTEAVHTPGPWEWRSFGGALMLSTRHSGCLIVLGAARHRMQEAKLLTRDPRCCLVDLTADHPDARLIAAAPELLKALQALRHIVLCMATGPGWTPDLVMNSLTFTEAALTKAGASAPAGQWEFLKQAAKP